MRVKIKHYSYEKKEEYITEEEVKVLFECKHVEDTKLYPNLQSVKFDPTSGYLLIENNESPYGFSVLWLVDRKNKIYEWEGFGHSGAASVICALLQKVIDLEATIQSEYGA